MMRRRSMLKLVAASALSRVAGASEKKPGSKAGDGFDAVADRALQQMRQKAEEMKIGGCAVVACFDGETIEAWSSKMIVVGRYKDEPKPGDKGSNLLAIVYAKAAEMVDTHLDSGSHVREPMTGELGWSGGVTAKGRNGWLIAAFSGGKSEDDVAVSKVGLEALKTVL